MKAHRGIFLECSVRPNQALFGYRSAAVVGRDTPLRRYVITLQHEARQEPYGRIK
jgi:hypothetical protein